MLTHELIPDHTVRIVEDTLRYRPQFGKARYLMGLLRKVLCRAREPVLVDVGASVGAFSLLAATVPDLRVHAFEPVLVLASVLQRNVAANDLCGRVMVHPIAVGEKVDVRTLCVPDEEAQMTLATLGELRRYEGRTTAVPVPMLPLDAFLPRRVDVIKVDVEGAELLVLKGAESILKICEPALLVEVEDKNTNQLGYESHEITDFLTGLGYRLREFKYNVYFWKREEYKP